MLKLTKKTDYGLMAMNCIAEEGVFGSPVSIKTIADKYRIPMELLAKILQRLAKQGFITAHIGPKGGYSLAKAPSEITVAEVVEAIEGPIGIVDCYHDEDQNCDQMDRCNIRRPLRIIQDSFVHLLESMTLAEMHSLDKLHYTTRSTL
ncbi:MAG: Rrf2 family transcriptional regulator [Nitrospirae bacterium]|nr:Rrf2 family transcriptional regulator [Nitrospirota bacterium]